MSILVTGGAGYIGSHAILTLLQNGYDVISLDNYCNSSPKSLERVEEICLSKIKKLRGDIRDRHILKNIFSKYNVSTVIHFAGLKSVNESIKKPLEYYDTNLLGTLILLDEMQKANISNLIFSSSATVYGNPHYVPISEKHPVGEVINPYGRSKFMVEHILRDFCNANSDANITILRYFNTLGAPETGLLGEDPLGTPNNLFPYVAQVAIGKLPYLNVFGNKYMTKDGTGVRDYIHVVDLVEGHLAALKNLNRNRGLKVFNLGTGQGYSVLDIIDAFKLETGRDIPFRIVSERNGDVAECWSDPSLANEQLSWVAKRTLNNMVEDAWRWQTMNPNGYKE